MPAARRAPKQANTGTRLVSGTHLADSKVREALWRAGEAAVEASERPVDPLRPCDRSRAPCDPRERLGLDVPGCADTGR